MVNIQEAEDEQYALLTDLLEAEIDYHIKCKEILEDLRNSWGTHRYAFPHSYERLWNLRLKTVLTVALVNP